MVKTNKELILEIIDKIPDYKLNYIISFLRGFQLNDEIEDDLYCSQLYDDYIHNTEIEDKETVSFEEALNILGVKLDV